MSLPDALLDKTWSTQYVPQPRGRLDPLTILIKNLENGEVTSRQLKVLSEECFDYVTARGHAEPKDELNDHNERTGPLRDCEISALHSHNSPATHDVLGFFIELKYQKTTYQVALLLNDSTTRRGCPFYTVLSKGGQPQIKKIKDWLDFKFDMPLAENLQLPPELLLQMCSRYLSTLSSCWSVYTDHTDALRQATLKQTVGSLKLTITFATGQDNDIASKLRTIDLDIPSETVNRFLDNARSKSRGKPDIGNDFLLELIGAVHEKTGLRLPLSIPTAGLPETTTTTLSGPPLKVTKITCSAFAIGTEGKIKLAAKPLENAEVIGYDENIVRAAYSAVLDTVKDEAERRSSNG
ncbi:hypothetical protein LTR64_000627 [Lithohypha guttulata]|uniref:uncharacterized protein n=1 Tax=Lithohypha guttulata TaxID=1690604 RepID=UPI002DDE6316|nr:hypothetical protein LTR51_005605 [Lithohypha guttulata]